MSLSPQAPINRKTPFIVIAGGVLLLSALVGGSLAEMSMVQKSQDEMYSIETKATEEEFSPVSETTTAVHVALTPGQRRGRALFSQTCIVCHGPSGAGTPTGANMRVSKFIPAKTDSQLVAFIKVGRKHSDPGALNLPSGADMPPNGANPNLTDSNLADIVSYIRTFQPAEAQPK